MSWASPEAPQGGRTVPSILGVVFVRLCGSVVLLEQPWMCEVPKQFEISATSSAVDWPCAAQCGVLVASLRSTATGVSHVSRGLSLSSNPLDTT